MKVYVFLLFAGLASAQLSTNPGVRKDASGNITANSVQSSDTSHNGANYLKGKTSGGVAWSVANVAGTAVTLLEPTDSATATTGYALTIGATTTCPDGLPSFAPATCRTTSWSAASGAAPSGTGWTHVTSGAWDTPVATLPNSALPSEYYAIATGTANAYVVAPVNAVTAYVGGEKYCWQANFTNTGSVTVAFSGLAAVPVRRWINGAMTDLSPGAIQTGAQVCGFYDGSAMQAYSGLNVGWSGTAALGTSAIASGACATVVTATATGVRSTDVLTASFNGDPTAITGYIPSTSGGLTIFSYPSSDAVNFKVCNESSGSITPGAVTLNWRVAR